MGLLHQLPRPRHILFLFLDVFLKLGNLNVGLNNILRSTGMLSGSPYLFLLLLFDHSLFSDWFVVLPVGVRSTFLICSLPVLLFRILSGLLGLLLLLFYLLLQGLQPMWLRVDDVCALVHDLGRNRCSSALFIVPLLGHSRLLCLLNCQLLSLRLRLLLLLPLLSSHSLNRVMLRHQVLLLLPPLLKLRLLLRSRSLPLLGMMTVLLVVLTLLVVVLLSLFFLLV